MALNLEIRNGILNNDPNWFFITDHNLNEYHAHPQTVAQWAKHSEDLEAWLPEDDELRRRWWRLMFIAFVQRNLKARGLKKHSYYEWGSEDYVLFERYPWLKELWVRQKIRLTAFIPPVETLRKRWWYGKRHDMVMRWEGGRNRYIKPRTKGDRVVASLIWCRHWQCWRLRLNMFCLGLLIVSLVLILFLF